MTTMLSDVSTYHVIQKDPTISLLTLVPFHHRFTISSDVYSIYIWSTKDAGVPLRPIVSFYTSPTYHLSKHLVGILSPLVCDSRALSVCLKNECLVSFDIIALFTRIPVDLALQIAHLRLENDVSFDDRTML